MRVGAKVLLLRVIESPPGELSMLGVADVMRTEAQQEAQELLDRFASISQSTAIELPETAIREGPVAREIFHLIQADEDIAMLVLAAGGSHKNPRPLVAELGRTAGTYPVPVVIVPVHLSDAELHALS